MTINRLGSIDTRGWPVLLRARLAAALYFDATDNIAAAETDAVRAFAARCSWFDGIDPLRGDQVPDDKEAARQVAELLQDADPLGGVVIDARAQWVAFAGALLVLDAMRAEAEAADPWEVARALAA